MTIGNYSKEVRDGVLVYSTTGKPVFKAPRLIDELPVTLNLLQWSIVRSAMIDAVNVNHARGFHNTARSTLAVYDLVCSQTEEQLTAACREPAEEEVA